MWMLTQNRVPGFAISSHFACNCNVRYVLYRSCILSSACDMFDIVKANGTCRFFPNVALKQANIFDFVEKSVDMDLYILHCSGNQENWIENADPYTNSQESKILHWYNYRWSGEMQFQIGIWAQLAPITSLLDTQWVRACPDLLFMACFNSTTM